MDYFLAGDKVRKIFWGLLIHTNNFCFLNIALFLLYLQFTFFPRRDGHIFHGWMDGQTRVLRSSPQELKNGNDAEDLVK